MLETLPIIAIILSSVSIAWSISTSLWIRDYNKQQNTRLISRQ